MPKHIVLTGFAACGKSTTGRLLARRLQRPFIDVDSEVARRHGDIAEIFSQEGEARFRDYEYAATAAALNSSEPVVIALGGGGLTDCRTRGLLAQSVLTTVFLDVPLEVIRRRLAGSPMVRPLLRDASRPGALQALYAARRDGYLGAHLAIDAGELTPSELVHRIISRLRYPRENATVP